MAIISAFPGKSKPKLQEKAVESNVFKTIVSSWNIYDEVLPDNKYDGIGIVKVKRIWPQATRASNLTFDFSANTIKFDVSSVYTSIYTGGGMTYIYPSANDLIGAYFWSDDTWDADRDNPKFKSVFLYFEKWLSDYNPNNYLYSTEKLFSTKDDGSTMIGQNGGNSIYVANYAAHKVTLSGIGVGQFKQNVSYDAYLIFNRIDRVN